MLVRTHISINKHKNTPQRKNYQENFSTNLETLNFIEICLKVFSLTGNLKHRGPGRLIHILVREMFCRSKPGSFSVSLGKEYIAEAAEMSVRHFQRTTKILSHHGIISVTPHPTRGFNTYTINLLLFDNVVRNSLKHLIRAIDDNWMKEYKKASVRNKENNKIICQWKWIRGQEAKLNRLNKYTISDSLSEEYRYSINASDHDLQKMSPFSKLNNIYAPARTCEETDDGILMTEPDWLVAAGTPINSPTVVSFKKNNQKEKTDNSFSVIDSSFSPLSYTVFKKDSYQHPDTENNVKHETLYSRTILAVTDQLKSVRPTIWGQIKMSAYPDEALLYADKKLLAVKKDISNRFGYFMGICKKYCEENKLEVKWAHALRLGNQYSMPANGPWIDENYIPPKEFVTDNHLIMSKNTPISVLLSAQYKDERIDMDREKELLDAKDELEKMAHDNPFAAILLRGVNNLSVEEKDSSEFKSTDVNDFEPVVDFKPLPIVSLMGNIESLMENIEFGDVESFYEDYEDDPFGDKTFN